MNLSRTKKRRIWAVCSLAAAALLMLIGATGLSAQAPKSATAVASRAGTDEEFARLVREWTTRPEFLSPLVDHLPAARGVPSPKDVLGYHIGQPKTLTYYADMLKYYRALAAAFATGTTSSSCPARDAPERGSSSTSRPSASRFRTESRTS